MITQGTIEKVKERASLIELVQEIVPVRRQGGRFVALCPFHKEKSPSFHIREEDKSYYCFGCGASGSIFTFVMQLRGLSFPEAIEELAARYRIPVERTGKTVERKSLLDKRLLFDLNQAANRYFRDMLSHAPSVVKDYVALRGISDESLAKFHIGFSGVERAGLVSYLTQKGASIDLVVRAGLGKRNDRGEVYDTFRNRLMFPVFIDPKRIAGFGGRAIPALVPPELKDSVPKYLNSPETPIYEKRRVLYGVPQAATAIRSEKEVYIVEGYLDVVGLAQVGIEQAVATCGTSLTHEHVLRLLRLSKRVTILFDGDRAGRAAAARSFPIFLNSPVDVQALFLPEGEDPDSMASKLKSNTSDALKKIQRLPLIECYLAGMAEREGVQRLSELGDNAAAAVARELAGLIRQVTDPVVRDRLIERVSMRLKMSEEQFRKGAPSAIERKESPVVEPRPADPIHLPFTALGRTTQEILYAIMVYRDELLEKALADPVVMQHLDPSAQAFLVAMSHTLKSNEGMNQKDEILSLLQANGESWLKAWKTAHAMSETPGVDLRAGFIESGKSFKRDGLRSYAKQLEREIGQAMSDGEKGLLLNEFVEVNRRLKELEAGGR